MKPVPVLFILLLSVLTASAQHIKNTEKISNEIVKEGKQLYSSEMASWYGTDLFLEKFPARRQNLGGYFSYRNSDNGLMNCVFLSKDEAPEVLATITFDSSYNVHTAQIDSVKRPFNPYEKDIYTIRSIAKEEIQRDTALFRRYRNIRLNLIPMISNGERKVYVLSGPEVSNVVIFGNDYLLTFDRRNRITGKERLHHNIIPVEYGARANKNDSSNNGSSNITLATLHSHAPETGEFITATDICTLMLYAPYAKWEQHIVVSKNYISIWDCEKNLLGILTKEAWDRIQQHQGTKHSE